METFMTYNSISSFPNSWDIYFYFIFCLHNLCTCVFLSSAILPQALTTHHVALTQGFISLNNSALPQPLGAHWSTCVKSCGPSEISLRLSASHSSTLGEDYKNQEPLFQPVSPAPVFDLLSCVLVSPWESIGGQNWMQHRTEAIQDICYFGMHNYKKNQFK
jgi:hypothetical protein